VSSSPYRPSGSSQMRFARGLLRPIWLEWDSIGTIPLTGSVEAWATMTARDEEYLMRAMANP
jgi:hypothetical protein